MDSPGMLTEFGLTFQEAKLYISLHGHGAGTGYELARLAGISRSNAYSGLAGLVDKGAANVVDGKPQRYVAVPVGEFCANRIRRQEEYRSALEEELVLVVEDDCPYITIRGGVNIADKIKTIIASTRTRIYLAMRGHLLREFVPQLAELASAGVKVVIVTDVRPPVPGAIIHVAGRLPESVRVIGDSAMTLTGELDGSSYCTCLYSVKKNLVNLIRDSIRSEILLIESASRGAQPDAGKAGLPS